MERAKEFAIVQIISEHRVDSALLLCSPRFALAFIEIICRNFPKLLGPPLGQITTFFQCVQNSEVGVVVLNCETEDEENLKKIFILVSKGCRFAFQWIYCIQTS